MAGVHGLDGRPMGRLRMHTVSTARLSWLETPRGSIDVSCLLRCAMHEDEYECGGSRSVLRWNDDGLALWGECFAEGVEEFAADAAAGGGVVAQQREKGGAVGCARDR